MPGGASKAVSLAAPTVPALLLAVAVLDIVDDVVEIDGTAAYGAFGGGL